MLCARDILADNDVRVDAEARLDDIIPKINQAHCTHAAVFEGRRFSCVVPLHAALRSNPQRIFADLASHQSLPVVSGSTPIEEIGLLIQNRSPAGVAVSDENGEYQGIITKDSLLGALLRESQCHLVELAQHRNQLEKIVAIRTGDLLSANEKLHGEIAERKLAETNMARSLRENETLIKELYHRTQNTMQLIIALLVLQAGRYGNNAELQAVVQSTSQRVQALALVQQKLYHSQDLSRIMIHTYIMDVAKLVTSSFGVDTQRITLRVDIEERAVLIDTAIPLGLIIHELLTNAFKHAFPDQRQGNIHLSLKHDEAGVCILGYSDNGIGATKDFDFFHPKFLGWSLIFKIAEIQLQGKVELATQNGIRFQLKFKDDTYAARV